MRKYYIVVAVSNLGTSMYYFKSRISAVNLFLVYSNTTQILEKVADDGFIFYAYDNWEGTSEEEIIYDESIGCLIRGDTKWN